MEALLRRVDGLEAKLKEKNSAEDISPTGLSEKESGDPALHEASADQSERAAKRIAIDTIHQQSENKGLMFLAASDSSR